jgi:hypothetical protein
MALASLFRFMRGPGWIGILTGVICVLNLAFVAGLLVVLGDTYALTSGPTPLLLGTLALPILSIAAWLTLVWQLVGHRSNWHVARAGSTLALATLVVSIPFYVILIEYNLLGFLI